MSIIIELRDVWKIYKEGEEGEVDALKEVNLHVKKGDFIAVMGPSGSGKTTAMNLIGSLDIPTRGKIFLDEHNIANLSESDLAQVRGRRIGFIFQQFNLIPNLTAKENVILPMIFQGKDEIEREVKAEELLKMVELGERMDHYPSELSGGQQQRVAIARALANDPEVILADEPTGNLDTHSGEIVMKFLNDLNEKGRTIIIVTHSPEIAMKHSKKIYWIKDGQVEKVTEKIKGSWKVQKSKKF
jgi:putative ABC transport system ATP-binding protein